jgi:hypothetical protein
MGLENSGQHLAGLHFPLVNPKEGGFVGRIEGMATLAHQTGVDWRKYFRQNLVEYLGEGKSLRL